MLDLKESKRRRKDVRGRLDGRGRAYDTIFVERLWSTVKYEEVYLHAYASPCEARLGQTRYRDFYNHGRLHQALRYRTPAEVYKPRGPLSGGGGNV